MGCMREEGGPDRGNSNCKGLEDEEGERKMHLECKQPKPPGLELGGQRRVAR